MVFSHCLRRASFLLVTLVFGLDASSVSAEPGLLLIAHGAPNAAWNRPVLEFGGRVEKAILAEGEFRAVRTALLEAAEPSIPTAVAELEAAGCDRIVAVPLFIAPTSHTHFDVPAALGVYCSPRTSAAMAAEHAKAARPRVPIVLTQTLAESDVLSRYALDEVRRLSENPREEAIVLLIHGDPEHDLLVERLMRRVTTHCCGEAAIGYGDWASIGVGQEYRSNGLPAIEGALRHKKRAIVVGLYLSTTAAAIHKRSTKPSKHGQGAEPADSLPERRIALSDKPIIDHPALLEWVVKTAREAVDQATP